MGYYNKNGCGFFAIIYRMIDSQSSSQKNLAAFQALLEVDEKERVIKRKEGYMKAYVLSTLLPPIGLYYFFKYLFFAHGTKEDFRAGVVSLILTLLSGLFSIWATVNMFRQTGAVLPKTGAVQELRQLFQ